MPDMVPVATMIRPPDPNQGLATLSSILGIRQAQQNLATGALQQQGVAADVQQQQQKNRELQAAQQLSIQGVKGGQYTKEDGSLDRMKLANDIASIGPYAQSMAGQLLSQANEVVSNQQAHQNLTVSQKKEMGDTFASLAADPQVDNTKVIDAIEKLRQAHRDDPEYSRLLTSQIMHFPNQATPDQQRAILGRWSAAATGEPQAAPNAIDTGTQIQPGTQNRFTGAQTPAGAPIAKQSVVTTPAGPLAVATPARGTLQPLGGGQPQNLNTTRAQQENVQGMAQDDRGRYAQVSQEGTNAQAGAQLADQVARLAEQVRTGKLSKEWADRLTALQQHSPGLTDRQMLSKYAAQLKTMATAGATTDASRSQIDEGMPSPETMGPDAVKEAAQYVGGIFRMRGARQAYADQYAKSNGSSLGFRGADDAFMRSADPTVFTYNSLPPGEERRQFLSKRFGNDAAKLREFSGRINQVKHYAGSIE